MQIDSELFDVLKKLDTSSELYCDTGPHEGLMRVTFVTVYLTDTELQKLHTVTR